MKQKLYYVHIFTCQDTRLFKTREQAQHQLEAYLSSVFGHVPKYYDGFGICSKEFSEDEIFYMGDAPFGQGGDYYYWEINKSAKFE
jgi:hypothetical protein